MPAGPPIRRARSGEIAGGEAIEWGRQANENPPVLRTHDRYGHRIDEVEFHPAYHKLMDVADLARAALAALDRGAPRRRTSRARPLFMVMGQAEGGHECPISMTYSAVPALRATPELAERVGAAPDVDLVRPAAACRPPTRPARSSAWR